MLFSGLLVYRKTFAELQNEQYCFVDDGNRFLIENGRVEVAVFYFRTGYSPDSYSSEKVGLSHLTLTTAGSVKISFE